MGKYLALSKKFKANKIIITEPGEHRVLEKIKKWPSACNCDVDIVEDDRFLSSITDFYWNGKTDMQCLSQAIGQTIDYAYAHRIQRLMITGNFALLAGLDPKQVSEWYLLVYIDAYEWVELANTLGMALYGGGGQMSSKPYAASGKYINKMFNYCQNCKHNPNKLLEEDACPFNALYWDFIGRNSEILLKNQRLKFVYANWNKMSDSKQEKIRNKAASFLSIL